MWRCLPFASLSAPSPAALGQDTPLGLDVVGRRAPGPERRRPSGRCPACGHQRRSRVDPRSRGAALHAARRSPHCARRVLLVVEQADGASTVRIYILRPPLLRPPVPMHAPEPPRCRCQLPFAFVVDRVVTIEKGSPLWSYGPFRRLHFADVELATSPCSRVISY